MKVLLLNTYDNQGGAARAAYRLHQGLMGIGVDSRMLVQRKNLPDRSILGPVGRQATLRSALQPALESLPTRLRRLPIDTFSTAAVGASSINRIRAEAPDLVHMHWVSHGFLRIEDLSRIERPLVWTLHDMWAFTGGCFYDAECGRFRRGCGHCPVLRSSIEDDLSRRVIKRKQRAWRGLDLTVITPSHWLRDRARESEILKDFRIETIPNGLDLSLYKPLDKHFCRQVFGLPQDKLLILFGALDSTSDRRKGFQHLEPALRELAAQGWRDRAEVVVIGASEPENPPDLGLTARYLGVLGDDVSLALVYGAADLFIAPSLQENLANTVMEALACGTPAAAFAIGGMGDMIIHAENGYLAQPFDPSDLASGIAWILEDRERWHTLSEQARLKAVQEFELGAVARRFERLYQEILETRAG